jgi:hypothetical protein
MPHERFVPVIPVLAMRPPIADRRLDHLKSWAQEEVFLWLDPRRSREKLTGVRYVGPRWCELPFDFGVQVGDTLLFDLDQDSSEEDSGAPLVEAYAILADELRRINAYLDPEGALLWQRRLLAEQNLGESMAYLVRAIELRPGDSTLWRRVWSDFRLALNDNSSVRHQVWALGRRFETDDSAPPIARLYATLWLTEAFEEREPLATEKRLLRLWAIVQHTELAVHDLANVLVRLSVTDAPTESGLPNPFAVRRALLWLRAKAMLSETSDDAAGSRLERQWMFTYSLHALARAEVDPALAVRAWEDCCTLSPDPDDRVKLFLGYARFLERQLRHGEAAAVYELARKQNTADREVAHERLARLLAGTASVEQARSVVVGSGDLQDSLSLRATVILGTASTKDEVFTIIDELVRSRSLERQHLEGAATALVRLGAIADLSNLARRAPALVGEDLRYSAVADLISTFLADGEYGVSLAEWARSLGASRNLAPFDLRVLALFAIDYGALLAWHDSVSLKLSPYAGLQWEIISALRRLESDVHAQLPDWSTPVRRLVARSGWPALLRLLSSRRDGGGNSPLSVAASIFHEWCVAAVSLAEELVFDTAIEERLSRTLDEKAVHQRVSEWRVITEDALSELPIGERLRELEFN